MDKDYSDIMVCEDCLIAHHYGWDPIEDTDPPEWSVGEGEQTTTTEPWGVLPDDLDFTDNTDGNNPDDTGIDEFSWRRCEGCGSHLGGARYRFAVWTRNEDNRYISENGAQS